MKKIITVICLSVIMFASCNKEGIKNNNIEEDVPISLNIDGEISVQEQPLTKAMSSNDLLGIVVKDLEAGNGPYFVAGLFDNTDNLNFNLKKGHTYNIRCALIKNGKNVVRNYEGAYGSPFGTINNGRISGTQLKNYFGYYNGTPEGYYYPNYSVYDWLADSNISFDGYFAEITNYAASIGETVTLNLRHTSMGVKYRVSGLTDGSLSITIKRGSNVLINKSEVSSNGDGSSVIFQCSDVYSAWKYPNTYKETLTVSVKWLRGIGITQDLGSVNVDVLRNRMNIININLSSEDENNGVGISLENTDMASENVTIAVQ